MWLGWFRLMMQQRKEWPRGSAEHTWRTNAARKYYWQIKGRPVNTWEKAQ
jgi:hypothetical protein